MMDYSQGRRDRSSYVAQSTKQHKTSTSSSSTSAAAAPRNSSASSSSHFDKIDGCKVEIILLPADEVAQPAKFNPGDRVMGYIFCLLSKKLTCTEFKLRLKGEASCCFEMFVNSFGDEEPTTKSWISTGFTKSNFIDSRQISTHSNKETYFVSLYDILKEDLPKTAKIETSGRNGSLGKYCLEPGEYRFPFSFQLPQKIPPSFTTNEGKIQYNLSVLISIPQHQSAHKLNNRTIEVTEKQHNQVASRQTSQNRDWEHSFGGGSGGEVVEEAIIGCCMPDHLDLSVSWDRDWYAPGDVMLISSVLTTTAPKEVSVHGGYINFIQVVTFTAKDGEIKVKENSVIKRDFICHPLNKFPITIPSDIPSSNLKYCSFITLKYIVRFKLYTEFTTMETKWTVRIGQSTSTDSSPSETASSDGRYHSETPNSRQNSSNSMEPSAPTMGRFHLEPNLYSNMESSCCSDQLNIVAFSKNEQRIRENMLSGVVTPPPYDEVIRQDMRRETTRDHSGSSLNCNSSQLTSSSNCVPNEYNIQSYHQNETIMRN